MDGAMPLLWLDFLQVTARRNANCCKLNRLLLSQLTNRMNKFCVKRSCCWPYIAPTMPGLNDSFRFCFRRLHGASMAGDEMRWMKFERKMKWEECDESREKERENQFIRMSNGIDKLSRSSFVRRVLDSFVLMKRNSTTKKMEKKCNFVRYVARGSCPMSVEQNLRPIDRSSFRFVSSFSKYHLPRPITPDNFCAVRRSFIKISRRFTAANAINTKMKLKCLRLCLF